MNLNIWEVFGDLVFVVVLFCFTFDREVVCFELLGEVIFVEDGDFWHSCGEGVGCASGK